ncbi:MAG: cyclase family protein [Firmicutes bacterium]|nr:cyclase family protein [Bacillota bacterium]
MKMIDLSQEIFSGLPVYQGHQPTVVHRLRQVKELPDGRWTFAVNALFISDHCGSHTDSFIHMDPSPEAKDISQLPLDIFHGIGICLDLSAVPPGEFITRADLQAALSRAGLQLPPRGTVLIYTGHYERTFPTPAYNARHPGLNREAMEWLADGGVINVGIDCPSVDVEPHQGAEWKPAHAVCRERQLLNTENLGDLRPVVGQEFYYLGLPLKIAGGTAGPIRAVAIFPEEGDSDARLWPFSRTPRPSLGV